MNEYPRRERKDGARPDRFTVWGEALDPEAVLQEYPHPQLVRDSYLNLNGLWQYAISAQPGVAPGAHAGEASTTAPGDVADGQILVPFSPETPLSGVGRQLQPGEELKYWRSFTMPEGFVQDKVLLHFGAVDQRCHVRVNGVEVGGHVGGYLPFTLDITDALRRGEHGRAGPHALEVTVQDDSDTSYHSRGKQKLKRGGIWYTAQSGIWQTVWLESLAGTHVEKLVIVPDLAGSAVELTVVGASGTATVVITDDVGELTTVEMNANVPNRIPLARSHPWSPEDPFLYDVAVRLGEDRVSSYFGLRSFGMGPDADGHLRLLLNGEPYFHAGLLDQGYWSDGFLTPPSDEALVYDIATAKRLGFTMLRKHIKIEPLRWYYHCDRLGMLVWQDMVNGGTDYKAPIITAPALLPIRLKDSHYERYGRASAQGRAEFMEELHQTVELLRNVASLAVWVPFNEAWGKFDALAATDELRRLDPTRTIDHASGWHDQGGGDLKSLHVYFTPFTLRKRWKKDSRAVALTEYGGYSLRMAGHDFSDREFGYRRFRSAADLGAAFVRLHEREIVPAIAGGLAAVVYTQLSDVEDELNGLLSYDRRVSKLHDHLVQGVTAQLVLNPPAPLSPDPETRNAMSPGMLVENEITSRVALTLPNGRLNPAAIGWSRTPLHDTSGIGRGMQRWGRNKRWEYWAITSPTHIVSLTVSSLDYAAVHELWVLDRATGVSIGTNVTGVLGGSATLPASLGDGSARAKTGKLQIDIAEVPGGTRLRASTPRVRLDIMAARPAGHESLGVVVPWNSRQFQYTVKDVARPASGTLSVDGVMVSLEAGESWAVLDHGRGRWPYSMHWNWGAGSGVTDGRTIGIQLGSKWTDGTGATENALLVDGRLHKISENLTWDYSTTNWLAPWHIHGATADLVFTPFYDKVSAINLGVLGNNTHQCFGHYDGEIADSDGNRIKVAGILGWAEDVHNRW